MYVCKWLYSYLMFESAVKLQMLIKCFTCVSTLEKIFTYNKKTFSCINDKITKMNNRGRFRNQLVESFFVRGGGYEGVCVCVCVCECCQTELYLLSSHNTPSPDGNQQSEGGKWEEKRQRERGNSGSERSGRCVPHTHSHEDSFVPRQTPSAAWQGDTGWL